MNTPDRPDAAFPSPFAAVGLFVLSQAIAIVLTWALGKIPVVRTWEWIDIAGTAIGYAIVLVYAFRCTGRPWRDVFPMRAIGPLGLFAVVVSTLGLLLVEWVMSAAVVAVLPEPEWFERLYDDLFTGTFGVGLVRVAIAAPIGEELLMRGVVLAGFTLRYGRSKAVVLSASVFALVHANPWQAVPAFLAGVLFAWWTLRAGSLWPALVAHVFGNAAIYAGTVAPDGFPGLGRLEEGLVWPPPAVVVAGAALLACGLALSARVLGPRVTYHEP